MLCTCKASCTHSWHQTVTKPSFRFRHNSGQSVTSARRVSRPATPVAALSRIWRVQLKKSHPRSAFRAREHSAPSSDFTKWPSACSAQHAFKDMRCNHPMRALPPTLRHGHDAQHAHSLSDCISDPPRPLYPTLPSLQHDGARAVPRALTIISSWCSVTIDRQAVFPRAYHAHYIMFHCL